MTDAPPRIALVHHSPDSRVVTGLAGALPGARIVRGREVPLAERALRFRGFATPLSQVPSCVAELRRESFDLAHAFSPQDAAAALLWRRMTGRPVVFGFAEPPSRETVADRRLSLRLLERALDESDAVVAHTEEARAAVWRWLAMDVPLLEPGGAERFYRELVT